MSWRLACAGLSRTSAEDSRLAADSSRTILYNRRCLTWELQVFTPHDDLVKFIFKTPDNAAGLLRTLLPAEVARLLDWSTLRLEDSNLLSSAHVEVSGSRVRPGYAPHGSRARDHSDGNKSRRRRVAIGPHLLGHAGPRPIRASSAGQVHPKLRVADR